MRLESWPARRCNFIALSPVSSIRRYPPSFSPHGIYISRAWYSHASVRARKASSKSPALRVVRYEPGAPKGSNLGKLSGNNRKYAASDSLRRLNVANDPSALRLVVDDCLRKVKDELRGSDLLKPLGIDITKFTSLWRSYCLDYLPRTLGSASVKIIRTGSSSLLSKALREAFLAQGIKGVHFRLKHAFLDWVYLNTFNIPDLSRQKAVADLRYPAEWYAGARTMKRAIHVHVGPTNSGKTYNAMKRLEAARMGVYGGPLRLLAHEVYTRLQAKGMRCALLTGEERRFPKPTKPPTEEEVGHKYGDFQYPDAPVVCSTVEMVPLQSKSPVVILDEIQMMGDDHRGWAWTEAVLGAQAEELHVCGEERVVPLMKQLAALTGDTIEIHRYKRLSPLEVAKESLKGDFGKLRKGDCIISFSVVSIHQIKQQIEKKTHKKVAVVYGALPPETRAQQARLFNDPDNDYDFLVASDAVGMGLNLSIKRVIFESASKYNGFMWQNLTYSEIKQIGGRAGRYKSVHEAIYSQPAAFSLDADREPIPVDDSTPDKEQSVPSGPPSNPSESDTSNQQNGIVTTLEDLDLPLVTQAFSNEAEPMKAAKVMPPNPFIQRFSDYFPTGTPLAYILVKIFDAAQVDPPFELVSLKDQLLVADAIEVVKELRLEERLVLIGTPLAIRDDDDQILMAALARRVATGKEGGILDIKELDLSVLEIDTTDIRQSLRDLEKLHKGIVAYLWLSFRFTGTFSTRSLAEHVKGLAEEKIEQCLAALGLKDTMRRKNLLSRQAQEEALQRATDDIALDESEDEAEGEAQEEVKWEGFAEAAADDNYDTTAVDVEKNGASIDSEGSIFSNAPTVPTSELEEVKESSPTETTKASGLSTSHEHPHKGNAPENRSTM